MYTSVIIAGPVDVDGDWIRLRDEELDWMLAVSSDSRQHTSWNGSQLVRGAVTITAEGQLFCSHDVCEISNGKRSVFIQHPGATSASWNGSHIAVSSDDNALSGKMDAQCSSCAGQGLVISVV